MTHPTAWPGERALFLSRIVILWIWNVSAGSPRRQGYGEHKIIVRP
jgi:hypothetical protein